MTPWVKRLITANVIVFFLEQTVPGLEAQLAFIPALAFVRPWTMITYIFVHASITHILFNMIALYFFGPRVESRLGETRFITLYMLSGISGALLSMMLAPNAPIVGASGAVFGVMLAFAKFWPRDQIMIWGIIPVEARILVFIMVATSIWSGWNGSRSGVADFAHLGGFVGAWAYLWWLSSTQGTKRFRSKTVAPVDRNTIANYKRVDISSIHEVNREEVNRILDKISSKGVGSLTAQEKLFLSNFVPADDRVPPPT